MYLENVSCNGYWSWLRPHCCVTDELMMIPHFTPVGAFPVLDLQSNSEWEMAFGSAAHAPIGHMTLPDSQAWWDWQQCDGLAYLGIHTGRYVHHTSLTVHTTKLPSTGKQNVWGVWHVPNWQPHTCRQDTAEMHSIGMRGGDFCISQLWDTH